MTDKLDVIIDMVTRLDEKVSDYKDVKKEVSDQGNRITSIESRNRTLAAVLGFMISILGLIGFQVFTSHTNVEIHK